MTDITLYGAVGDGVFNCSPAIRQALEKETEILLEIVKAYAQTEKEAK